MARGDQSWVRQYLEDFLGDGGLDDLPLSPRQKQRLELTFRTEVLRQEVRRRRPDLFKQRD